MLSFTRRFVQMLHNRSFKICMQQLLQRVLSAMLYGTGQPRRTLQGQFCDGFSKRRSRKQDPVKNIKFLKTTARGRSKQCNTVKRIIYCSHKHKFSRDNLYISNVSVTSYTKIYLQHFFCNTDKKCILVCLQCCSFHLGWNSAITL